MKLFLKLSQPSMPARWSPRCWTPTRGWCAWRSRRSSRIVRWRSRLPWRGAPWICSAPTDQRVLAIRALGGTRAPAARDTLLELTEGGRTFLRRERQPPLPLLAALRALAAGWANHTGARRVLARAAASKDPDTGALPRSASGARMGEDPSLLTAFAQALATMTLLYVWGTPARERAMSVRPSGSCKTCRRRLPIRCSRFSATTSCSGACRSEGSADGLVGATGALSGVPRTRWAGRSLNLSWMSCWPG